MGAWANQPWDNDAAADWFGDLFDKTGLAVEVERTLTEADPEEEYEEIRAAAYLVRMLGRTYIWPVNDIDRHRKLAADKLQVALDAEVYDEDGPDFRAAIEQEIAELRAGEPK